jgi:predicted ester cyclase
VATRWVYHGTHRGTVFDIPATGKRVTFTGVSIDRVVDGRIVETASEWDLVGALRQLGATRLPDEEPMSESRAGS